MYDWWGILKVEIDFTMIKPPDTMTRIGDSLGAHEMSPRQPDGAPRPPPGQGYWGVYDREEDKIWINLAMWKGQNYNVEDPFDDEYQQRPLTDKLGNEEPDDQTLSEDIIETIMHESGHAAALSKDAADLNDEIEDWILTRLSEHAPKEEDADFNRMRPIIGQFVDYLVHEYIASICERREKPGPTALKDAWDQTVGARMDTLMELTTHSVELGAERPAPDIGHNVLETQNMMNWEISDYLIPIFDKYFNQMGSTMFRAYQEGVSRKDKENFETLTGETANPKTRGTLAQTFNPNRAKDAVKEKEQSWMDQLRGE